MAFIKYGALNSNSAPVLKKFTIANSVVMTPNASVVLTSGFVALSTSSTYAVLGQVDAIQTFAGVGEITTGAAGATIGSFLGTYTVASNNQTVAKVSALVDISQFTLYSVLANATLGTTTGSNLPGYYTALATSQTTAESSATATNSSVAYTIWGVDPLAPTTNQIVSILNSQVFS